MPLQRSPIRPRWLAGLAAHNCKVPQGFEIEEYATDFNTPRFMYTGPSGEILVSDSSAGTVYVLVDKNKSYKNPERKQLLTGLDRPYGLAIWKDYLYVGEPTSVKRYKYDSKNLTAGPGEQIASLKDFKQGHWTRSLLFDAKGEKLYVGVGSGSNVNTGEDPMRAAINRFNPDGSGHEIFASGTRNPIGLHWYPGTDTLWAAVQERDALGDDLVPDYFTHIQQGAFYGWPYAYSGPHEEPRHKGERPDLVAKTIAGDVLLQSHVAVLDFLFYTGKQFPAEYQGGAFLAFHGSWNRSKRVGYEVAFHSVPGRQAKRPGPRVSDRLDDFARVARGVGTAGRRSCNCRTAAFWCRTMAGRRFGGSSTRARLQATGCGRQAAGGRMQEALWNARWWLLLSAACLLAPGASRLLAQAPPPLKEFSHAKHLKLGNVAPVIAGAIDKGTLSWAGWG